MSNDKIEVCPDEEKAAGKFMRDSNLPCDMFYSRGVAAYAKSVTASSQEALSQKDAKIKELEFHYEQAKEGTRIRNVEITKLKAQVNILLADGAKLSDQLYEAENDPRYVRATDKLFIDCLRDLWHVQRINMTKGIDAKEYVVMVGSYLDKWDTVLQPKEAPLSQQWKEQLDLDKGERRKQSDGLCDKEELSAEEQFESFATNSMVKELERMESAEERVMAALTNEWQHTSELASKVTLGRAKDLIDTLETLELKQLIDYKKEKSSMGLSSHYYRLKQEAQPDNLPTTYSDGLRDGLNSKQPVIGTKLRKAIDNLKNNASHLLALKQPNGNDIGNLCMDIDKVVEAAKDCQPQEGVPKELRGAINYLANIYDAPDFDIMQLPLNIRIGIENVRDIANKYQKSQQ